MASDDRPANSSQQLDKDKVAQELAQGHQAEQDAQGTGADSLEYDSVRHSPLALERGGDDRLYFLASAAEEADPVGRFVQNEVRRQVTVVQQRVQVLHDDKVGEAALLSVDLREGDIAELPGDSVRPGRSDAEHRSEDGGTGEGGTEAEEHKVVLRQQEETDGYREPDPEAAGFSGGQPAGRLETDRHPAELQEVVVVDLREDGEAGVLPHPVQHHPQLLQGSQQENSQPLLHHFGPGQHITHLPVVLVVLCQPF